MFFIFKKIHGITMDVVSTLYQYLPDGMNVMYSLITIAAAVLINRLVFHGLINRMAKKAGVEKHYVKPLRHASSAIVYLAALFTILYIFGVTTSLASLVTGAGIAGIVIGLALQDVLSGVISGIILFVTRPFKIGDWVEINNYEGMVKDLRLQRTELITLDGEDVTLPNSEVNNSPIVNKTKSPESRIEVTIGVDYDTDMEKAIGICEEILQDNDYVLSDKPQKTLVQEFGGSSINLTLRFWINRTEIQNSSTNLGQLKSDIRNEIVERFREKDIEIPFPHMEIIKKD
ncbi:MAG: mechanosensitive ion channel family protein [Candidatus Aenigmatarchaeota archaeon]